MHEVQDLVRPIILSVGLLVLYCPFGKFISLLIVTGVRTVVERTPNKRRKMFLPYMHII